MVWLKIHIPFKCHPEGATCQCGEVVRTKNFQKQPKIQMYCYYLFSFSKALICLALEYLLPKPMGNMIGFGNISSEQEFDNMIHMEETIVKQAHIIDDLQYKLFQLKTIDSLSTQQEAIMEEDHAQ